ncbi:MAG: ABC transporter substrate-binding protein [Methanomicrobiales archaeon]|nr:ABC transporter substrate-binding protein [Methanomicrobiales archaeon]
MSVPRPCLVLLATALAAGILFAPVAATNSLPLGAKEKLTGELVGASVCGYMLGTNDLTLDEVSDAAYVYAVWGGKPKTVTDATGRTVTLYRPIKRIATEAPDNARMLITLGAGHLIVGADRSTVEGGCICPTAGDDQLLCEECWERVVPGGLNNLPETGSGGPTWITYHEEIAILKPDLIFARQGSADEMQGRVGAPVFVATGVNSSVYESVADHARSIGAALSKEREAEDLIVFLDSKVKQVTDITDTIPESEKPRVYFAPRGASKGFHDADMGRDFTRTVNAYYPLAMAGGINVAEDVVGSNIAVEQLLVWDPDVIFVAGSAPDGGAGVNFVLNAPELRSLKAVQEGRVYNVFYPYCCGSPHDKNLLNVFYMARILHPDKFADIDMEKEGNEIMTAFLGVDGVYSAYADYLEFPRTQKI